MAGSSLAVNVDEERGFGWLPDRAGAMAPALGWIFVVARIGRIDQLTRSWPANLPMACCCLMFLPGKAVRFKNYFARKGVRKAFCEERDQRSAASTGLICSARWGRLRAFLTAASLSGRRWRPHELWTAAQWQPPLAAMTSAPGPANLSLGSWI